MSMSLLYISADYTSVFILVTYLLLSLLVANFGKRTALGFRGVLLISLLVSPLTALLVVLLFRSRETRKG